jgi:hypothetical protein
MYVYHAHNTLCTYLWLHIQVICHKILVTHVINGPYGLIYDEYNPISIHIGE